MQSIFLIPFFTTGHTSPIEKEARPRPTPSTNPHNDPHPLRRADCTTVKDNDDCTDFLHTKQFRRTQSFPSRLLELCDFSELTQFSCKVCYPLMHALVASFFKILIASKTIQFCFTVQRERHVPSLKILLSSFRHYMIKAKQITLYVVYVQVGWRAEPALL